MKELIAVIGDTHARIDLAAEALDRIEGHYQRTISQVFSVGDFGLFLDEADWGFLSGPKKYRHPEQSKTIRAAWKSWRWPLSAIAGNHEPFNRLREFDPDYFEGKLNYSNAGELTHSIQGLRVLGLSGIYHPEEYSSRLTGSVSWSDMLAQVKAQKVSNKFLSYYKKEEVELLKRMEPKPGLILLHDWPMKPEHISDMHRRPEAEIVEALAPAFVCCGHHHTPCHSTIGATKVFALNIISSREDRYHINANWCALFEYDGGELSFLDTWPNPSESIR